MAYVFSHGYSIRSGFPHSDIGGSKLVCQLPTAFRRLPRPSSPVIAKASTTCTCSLDPITGVSLSTRVGALALTLVPSPKGTGSRRTDQFTSLQVEYSCCAVFQKRSFDLSFHTLIQSQP